MQNANSKCKVQSVKCKVQMQIQRAIFSEFCKPESRKLQSQMQSAQMYNAMQIQVIFNEIL